MPKLVDYSARFDFIREAVCTVVLRGGAEAVNMRTVAAELRLSVASLRRALNSSEALPVLGLQLIERRRRARWLRGSGESDPLGRALAALAAELPLDEQRVEEAVVWGALTAARSRQDDRVHKLAADRDTALDSLVGRLVSVAEVPEPDRDYESTRLRAVVDGLTAAVCVGRLATTEAGRMLHRHVEELASTQAGRIP